MLRCELLKLMATLPFASLLGVKAKPLSVPTDHYWTGKAGNAYWEDSDNGERVVLPAEEQKSKSPPLEPKTVVMLNRPDFSLGKEEAIKKASREMFKALTGMDAPE